MTARFSPLVFWLLALPFAANDIGLILANDAASWLAVDYGSKLLVVAAILGTPSLRRAFIGRFAVSIPWLRCGAAALVVSVVSIAVLEGLDRTGLDGWTALQSFYPIDHTGLLVFDLTLGLLLTAVAEEAVFRGAFLDLFNTRLSSLAIYLLSAMVFAAVHWSNGMGTIIGAGVVGALLMWLTRASGSLLPAIAAHFAINLVLFWP